MELAFLTPSPMEIMVIAVIALIVLGPSRLPEAARSLGKGMREMRESFQNAGADDDRHRLEEDDVLDEDDGLDDDAELEAYQEDDPVEADDDGVEAGDRAASNKA